MRDIIRSRFVSNGFDYFDVCGNHDLYGLRWDNVFNQTLIYNFNGLKIVAGPMWTHFDGMAGVVREAQRYINDFRCIEKGPGLSGVLKAGDMKAECNAFMATVELTRPDVVVSHFAPDPQSSHPRFAGSQLNAYFCPTVLKHLDFRPKLWLHGHIHDPVDYKIGETRVVANPLGYPRETYFPDSMYRMKVIEV